MSKPSVTISILIAGILGFGIYFVTSSSTDVKNENINSSKPSEQKLGTNGITFTSPIDLEWLDVPSTEGNYKNYQVNSRIVRNSSSIMVSIPLKESSQHYTLENELKGVTDTSKIQQAALDGHAGQRITYRKDTTAPGDVPWIGTITIGEYTSPFVSSPVRLEYHQGDGDASLDAVWEQVRSSLKW